MNEERKELIQRLWEASVGGCECLTKTPEIQYHAPICKFRLFQESITALEAASLNERRLSDFLHDRRIHPDYEYRTTTGQRKCWDGDPDLTKEGWELNKTASNQDAFERFEYHEEMHWRRALSGEGVGDGR